MELLKLMQFNGTAISSVLVVPTAGSGSIVPTLDAGSITSGFGAIDNGASAITTTGTITGGAVAVTGAGNRQCLLHQTDGIASMETGGATGGFIDLNILFSDDFDFD